MEVVGHTLCHTASASQPSLFLMCCPCAWGPVVGGCGFAGCLGVTLGVGILGLSPEAELTDSTSISVMFQKAFQKCTSRFCMMRSNSAPRNSGSMANRPPVKRELAVTPGEQGEGVKEPWWQPDCSAGLGKGGQERVWAGSSCHSLRPVSLRL